MAVQAREAYGWTTVRARARKRRTIRRKIWKRRTVPLLAGTAVPSGGRRERGGDRLAVQLAVCGGAFVLLVAAKLLLPGGAAALRQSLGGAMERNLDVRAVFSAVGRAVSGEENGAEEVWQAVFSPLEPDAFSGMDAPDGDSEPDAVESAQAVQSENQSLPDGTAYTVQPGQGGQAWDVLRQYRPGAAAGRVEPSEEPSGGTDGGAGGGTDDGTADGTDSGTVGGTQPGSPVLPEKVSMEQVILNFNYRTPVFGTLTSGFGLRTDPIQGTEKFHHGVDLAAPSGTDILCFADGTVAAVGESTSYGKYCIVDHAGGCSTLYAHCSRITASSGAAVSMGEKIAEVGATGAATGPHLHFELHRSGTYLNPIYYVAHD